MATKQGREYANPFNDFHPDQANELVDINTKQILPKFQHLIQHYCTNKLIPELAEGIRSLDRRDYTVYTGTMGFAMLYYLLSERLNKPAYIDLGIQLVDEALPRLKRSQTSFLLGDAGPLAIGALLYSKRGSREGKDKSTQHILRLTSLLKDVLVEDNNDEVLYGRAGYLYALLFVNKHLGSCSVQPRIIKQVIAAILASGQKIAREEKRKVPLMYMWHDSYYLGAAHGMVGILHALLQAEEFLSKTELDTLVRPSINYLLSLRFKSGNLPSSLGKDSDRLVQWCHGAPGFVHLLCLAYKIFGDERYLRAAMACGEVVWQRGLLTKGYSLCHGVAGNTYTFLQLYQTTGDVKHLYRASQFAYWCTFYPPRQNREPDRPFSMFEGMAGVLYMLVDYQRPLESRFPGFSL